MLLKIHRTAQSRSAGSGGRSRSDCQSERSGHSGPAVPAWAPPYEAPRQKKVMQRDW